MVNSIYSKTLKEFLFEKYNSSLFSKLFDNDSYSKREISRYKPFKNRLLDLIFVFTIHTFKWDVFK